jgi:hypothetical protein
MLVTYLLTSPSISNYHGFCCKVKEFVKGGEFEKIHRNETQTRDRDELSR